MGEWDYFSTSKLCKNHQLRLQFHRVPPGHFGAHGFPNLHRHGAHAAPGARDQEPLAGLQMATGDQAVVTWEEPDFDGKWWEMMAREL